MDSASLDGQAQLPAITMEVIQGGAFSTSEKGNEMVQSIQSSGFPAILTTETEPLYLLVGLAANRSEVEALQGLYAAAGHDTYLKSYEVNGEVASQVNDEIADWFTGAMEVVHQLSALSVDGLTTAASFDSDQAQLIEQINQLQEESAQIVESYSDTVEPYARDISQALTEAARYIQEQEESSLWQAQQQLLNAFMSYDAFVQQLS